MAVTRVEFILQKARNMRDWLRPNLSESDAAQFDESRVMEMVATVLLPLHAAGKVDVAVDELYNRLQHVPSEQQHEYKVKIRRYLTCFCEALM